MRFLTLDIETIRRTDMPARKEREVQRIDVWESGPGLHPPMNGVLHPKPDDFPPAPYWQIVCASLALVTEHGVSVDSCAKTEPEILAWIAEMTSRFPLVVTFNGRHFDVPVIAASALRHRVQWPWRWRHAEQRFDWPQAEPTFTVKCAYDAKLIEAFKVRRGTWDKATQLWTLPGKEREDAVLLLGNAGVSGEVSACLPPTLPKAGHIDLMNELADRGAADRASLDAWCATCGVPPKPAHGNEVEEMVARGEVWRASAYCNGDALRTAVVAIRHCEARGFVSAEEADRLVAEALGLIRREDETALTGGIAA